MSKTVEGISENRQRKVARGDQVVEIHDAFTGEAFKARAHNHYEENSGEPHDVEIDQPRLSVRERVQLLTQGSFDYQAAYLRMIADAEDDDDPTNLDLVDPNDADPNDPMTSAEVNYLAGVAAREKQIRDDIAASAPPVPENAPAASPAPASPLPVAPEAPRPPSPQPAPGSGTS